MGVETLAAISTIATVVGTTAQYSQQKKAADLTQKSNNLATRRSSIQAIREVQMKRASAVNEAVNSGAVGGSAIAGGMTGLGSQLGSGLGYASQQSGLSGDISRAGQRAELYGAIGKLGAYGVKQFGLPGSTKGQ